MTSEPLHDSILREIAAGGDANPDVQTPDIEPQGYDKEALEEFIAVGSVAWADVPDAAKWVRELRGG